MAISRCYAVMAIGAFPLNVRIQISFVLLLTNHSIWQCGHGLTLKHTALGISTVLPIDLCFPVTC